jgi:hypothetical protein
MDIHRSEYRPQAVWKLRSYVQDRWKLEAFPTLNYSTQKLYESMFDAHLSPAFGDTQLPLVTREAVPSLMLTKTRSSRIAGFLN